MLVLVAHLAGAGTEVAAYRSLSEEVALLLGAARCDRFRTILRLIYHTGLRIREACRIEVQHIDRAGDRIHVKEGKGGKDRDVLQDIIAVLRDKDFGIDMQFDNYRSN